MEEPTWEYLGTSSDYMFHKKMSLQLCDFLGVPHNRIMQRRDAIKIIIQYIQKNHLETPYRTNYSFEPDEKLANLLGTTETFCFYKLEDYLIQQGHFF